MRTNVMGAALAAIFALAGPLMAGDIKVMDAYARSSGKLAKSGAAFMVIVNEGDREDRLISVETGIAQRAELHTHKESADGVMRMVEVEDGFPVPAGGRHMLSRGGDHVMLMGLTQVLEHGGSVPMVLIFEQAGRVEIEVPVDQERQPEHGHGMKHDHGMKHGG